MNWRKYGIQQVANAFKELDSPEDAAQALKQLQNILREKANKVAKQDGSEPEDSRPWATLFTAIDESRLKKIWRERTASVPNSSDDPFAPWEER